MGNFTTGDLRRLYKSETGKKYTETKVSDKKTSYEVYEVISDDYVSWLEEQFIFFNEKFKDCVKIN